MKSLKITDYEMGDTVKITRYGRVKTAKNKRTSEWIAIKSTKKQELIKNNQIEHSLNELINLSSISHPSILNYFGFFQDEKYLYLGLEYVNGGDLFGNLRAEGSFSSEKSAFYLGQIIFALQYLHSQNIIYRNLVPESILICKNGYIKLSGFEFSKKIEDDGRTYTVCGTPGYMAPEIIQNKGHGKAVDWWAFGVLLYEMICGIDPFSDEDPIIIYQNILDGKIKFTSQFDSNAKSLVKHLLEPDLSKRFGNLKGGINDIKNHPFFANVDWDKLMRGEVQAPFIPKVASDGDVSNYNLYPDSNGDAEALDKNNDPFLDWSN